jgi:hypothetical protein
MIWWLNEIDKFYNYLKKRVLRDKFARERHHEKKKFMGQKNHFHQPNKFVPRECNQFSIFCFLLKRAISIGRSPQKKPI